MKDLSRPWESAFPPFRILGNLYFVGTVPASSHLVDTGDGLILLDAGYMQSLYLVLDGIHRMGFDAHDLKAVLLTHGHVDHFGAARALRELTGAKLVLGEKDRDAATGANDLSWAKELGVPFPETFEPDILLHDGDELTFGDTTFTAIATPGHTAGAMSFLFPVKDGGETYTALLQGGMGLNSLQREYLDRYGLPYSLREDFKRSMERIASIPNDIFLGNHMHQNHTAEKYKALVAGDRFAFVDKDGSAAYALSQKNALEKLEASEKR